MINRWLGLVLALNMFSSGCQGFGERRVPSHDEFEVQRVQMASDSQNDQDGDTPQEATTPSDHVLPESSPHPTELTIEVIEDKSGRTRNLFCSLRLSTLSKHIFRELNTEGMSITHAQSKLWIETSVSSEFQSYFKESSSKEKMQPDALPSYDPIKDKGGAWVIYQSLSGGLQSLILTKSAPWMCDRAWLVARCEVNEVLEELSNMPRQPSGEILSPLKLRLVSATYTVHSEDEDLK